MKEFQEKVSNELKKIIKEDLPKILTEEQKLKLKQIEKELCDNEQEY